MCLIELLFGDVLCVVFVFEYKVCLEDGFVFVDVFKGVDVKFVLFVLLCDVRILFNLNYDFSVYFDE